MIYDLEDYNILTMSMREHYVPAWQWMKHVEELESNARYTYTYNEETYEKLRGRYMLPYPFKRSYYYEYLQAMSRNNRKMSSFNEDDKAACKEAIDARMVRYLENAVSDVVFAWIDGNSDYGVVLHSTTGRYFPFQYSATDGFCFTCMSATGILSEVSEDLKKVAKHQAAVNRNAALTMANRAVALQNKIPENHGRFYLTYAVQYKHPDGDDFFTPGVYGNPTELTTLDISQVQATRDYMQEMYRNHAKTLIVT